MSSALGAVFQMLHFIIKNRLWYLLVFVQMEDVDQWSDGGAAVGTLEGQVAGGQGRHQAAALVPVQGVVEFDGACF